MYLQQCYLLEASHAAKLDQLSVDGILGILEIDPHENTALGHSSARWFLPWSSGGCGFTAVQHGAHANFVGSWFRDLAGIAERMELASPGALLEQAPCIKKALQEAVTHLNAIGASLPESVEQALTDSTGSKLASLLRSQVVTRIVHNIESGAINDQIVCMHESGGSGAGAWMKFPKQPRQHMTNQEIRTSIRLRMHLDVYRKDLAERLHCKHKASVQRGGRICDDNLDTKGLHALLCKLGGHVVRRHNRGRDCLAELIDSRVQSNVHVEQHTPEMVADERHPDIDFFDHEQRHVYIDIEVCTPHARALPGVGALHKKGALIEIAEGVKRRKYAHLTLVPFLCSHLGRFGKGVQTLMRLICRDVDEDQRSSSIDECYQTLGCEIQKANVALLEAAGTLL